MSALMCSSSQTVGGRASGNVTALLSSVRAAGPSTWNGVRAASRARRPAGLWRTCYRHGPVALGDHWRALATKRRAGVWSEYDVITSNTLDASLETADAGTARIRLTGQVLGSARGGPGKMICE